MSIFKIGERGLLSAKVFLAAFVFMAVVPFAHAAGNTIIFNSTTSYTTVNDLVTAVVNWFLSVTAGITIFFLIIGGVYYLTAFGDDKRMQEGKKIITYAVYGLILILISYSVVNTINAIIFN